MELVQKLIRFARKSRREISRIIYSNLGEMDWYWKVHSPGNDRTTYVVGLFGSGRGYMCYLMRKHIGERTKYFRWDMRLRRCGTSMIYTGHATIRHVCRHQALPAVTGALLEAARLRLADVIFIYRHPLDSLLTNWVYWREYLRGNKRAFSVLLVYSSSDDLCADLDKNFSEFKAFAEGDPDFFAAAPGLPFLSFSEFVEETELCLESATLSLRLEDFIIDPIEEFSKIVKLMSIDLDLSRLKLDPPTAKPYGYLAVKEKVPRFRDFINGLDAETKRRIEKIGYKVGE